MQPRFPTSSFNSTRCGHSSADHPTNRCVSASAVQPNQEAGMMIMHMSRTISETYNPTGRRTPISAWAGETIPQRNDVPRGRSDTRRPRPRKRGSPTPAPLHHPPVSGRPRSDGDIPVNSSRIETFAPRLGTNTVGWASLLSEMLRQALAWIRHQRQIRRNTALLMAFHDHALADIGLSRGEVLYAVHHGRLPEGSALQQNEPY